jgi:hypothetical protein
VQSERGGTWPWDGGERVHVAPTHPIRDAVVDIGSALTLREAIVEGAEAKPFCLAHLHLRRILEITKILLVTSPAKLSRGMLAPLSTPSSVC